jgi:FkbM family methyltransferase
MTMTKSLLRYVKRLAIVFGNLTKRSKIANYIVLLDMNESIQRSIYLEEFEPEETEWFYSLVKPGMVIVDVGSNVGYYSLISSYLVGGLGEVYSFDPSNYAYKKLNETIRENHITNIKLFNIGLSDHPEERELLLRDIALHSPSFCYGDEYPTTPIGTSKLITLDCFAEEAGIDHIDLIKIDVEGMEMNILKGMTRLLQQNKVHRIMIEFNGYWLKLTKTSQSDLDAFLKQCGFEIEFKKEYQCRPDEISIGNYMYVSKLAGEKLC